MSEWNFSHLGGYSESVFPGTPALPLSGCVTLGSSLNLSEPQFLCLQSGVEQRYFPPWVKVRIIKRKMRLDYLLAHR